MTPRPHPVRDRVTAPGLRRARVAVFAYFFVLGVASATWAARLPAIKEDMHLSDARLGLALFAVPAGAALLIPAGLAVLVAAAAGVLSPHETRRDRQARRD